MSTIIVLQARTNSSRLPGKVLLPVGELPLVILAAKRAINTGRKLIVATSQEESDDVLVQTLNNYGIECFRGDLHNTLNRIVEAVASYDDETILVRLTGDNTLPDGCFIDEVVEEFHQKNLEYLCCNGQSSGLPYGLSIEVTRVKHLREANDRTLDVYDREHVTPFIKRKFGSIFFQKYSSLEKGHLRCTVDYFEDYLTIAKVFSKFSDPVHVSVFDLVKQLDDLVGGYKASGILSKLVIGAVQLGMDYGIANCSGMPDDNETSLLLKAAINNGIQYIDTARAYGRSEERISQSLGPAWLDRVVIITKLSPFSTVPSSRLCDSIEAYVESSVYESCLMLGKSSLDVLLLHRSEHFHACDGKLFAHLVKLQQRGLIKALGVSVQHPDELNSVLKNEYIKFIQLPFNLLDWRWEQARSEIMQQKQLRNFSVHVRSVFLQGLLLSSDEDLWKKANMYESGIVQEWLNDSCKRYGCVDIGELCIRYVNSQSWIDGVVMGMETRQQLEQNIRAFQKPLFSLEQLQSIENSRPFMDEEVLNPAFWSNQ